MLSDYTNYNDIRAVLGVADEELPNDTLEIEVNRLALQLDLSSLSPTLPADYLSIQAAATRTASEQAVYDAVRLYAPFAVASQLLQSLPMFAPREINDSKTKIVRDSNSPHAETAARCALNYAKYREHLRVSYGAYKQVTTARTANFPFFLGAKPATDPVTG